VLAARRDSSRCRPLDSLIVCTLHALPSTATGVAHCGQAARPRRAADWPAFGANRVPTRPICPTRTRTRRKAHQRRAQERHETFEPLGAEAYEPEPQTRHVNEWRHAPASRTGRAEGWGTPYYTTQADPRTSAGWPYVSQLHGRRRRTDGPTPRKSGPHAPTMQKGGCGVHARPLLTPQGCEGTDPALLLAPPRGPRGSCTAGTRP
jgi:hypothetical protein